MTTDPIALPPKPVTTYVIGVQSDGYSDDRLHDRAAYDDDQLDAYAREAVRLDREHDKPLTAALEALGAMRTRAEKAEARAGSVPAGELYLGLCLDDDDTLHATIMRKGGADVTVILSDYVKMPRGRDVILRGDDTSSPSTAPDEETSRDAEAFALGMAARMRAAGMASLLAEVLAQNAARDLDDDLKERMDRAIADQNAARTQGDAA